jgi:hypothetical protein
LFTALALSNRHAPFICSSLLLNSAESSVPVDTSQVREMECIIELQLQSPVGRFYFVVYFMTLNGRMIGIRKDSKGSDRVLFKVLSRHLPERTEENYEICQSR